MTTMANPRLRRAAGRALSTATILVITLLAGCGSPGDTAQSTTTITSALSAQPVSEALRLLDDSLRTPCPDMPVDVCADHTGLVIMRTRIVLRDLQNRPDAAELTEGIGIARSVIAAEGTDLSTSQAQAVVLADARDFHRWLATIVPGYPPTLVPTGR
jgi:hypothetical protein